MTYLLPRLAVLLIAALRLGADDGQSHTSGLADAIMLRQQGRSHDAGSLLEKLARQPGAPPGIAARIQNALGLVRRDQGRWDDAVSLFEAGLTAIPTETTDCALRPTITGNLGEARLQQGRFREARSLFESALQMASRCAAKDRVFASLQMLNLAGLARMQGDYNLAQRLGETAHRELRNKLGDQHPQTVLAVNNLAQIYAAQGRQKQAMSAMQQVRELARKVHGERHHLYAGATSNLGVAYYMQGRYAEAETLFREALAITESTYGPEHPAVLRDRNNLAAVLDSTGRGDDAEELLRRVIAASRTTGRPDVRAMASLGTIELSRGRVDDAAGWFTEVSQLLRAGTVAPDPDLAKRLDQFAMALRRIERPADAERYQAEATRIRTRTLIDIQALRQLNYSKLWKGNRQ